MIDRYQKDEFFTLLDKNSKLQKLITSISYSESHSVDIINTDSAILLNLIVEYIDRELIKLSVDREMISISIDRGLDNFFEELESYFYNQKSYLFIFDFTSLDESKESEYLFMMINKERNKILERLDNPILLVIPKKIQKLFAYSAFDFWSVKKYSVDILYSFPQETSISLDIPTDKDIKMNTELSKLLDKNKALAKRFEENKNTLYIIRLYLISLIEVGDYYAMYGDLSTSFEYYEQAVDIARYQKSLVNKEEKSDSIEAKRDVSVSLNKLADIYLQKGEVAKALQHYQDGLELRQEIQNQRPDSIEAKRDVSVSLEKLADIYLQKGEVAKSLQHYQESLELRQEIQNQRPDSIEAKRDVSVSFYKLSTVYLHQEEFVKAIKYLEKAKEAIVEFRELGYGDFGQMIERIESEILKLSKQYTLSKGAS